MATVNKDLFKHIHIGLSGWSYKDWKGIFYPEDIASTDWLEFYAQTYDTTEINSSFYHTPRIQTVAKWVEKVPKGFRFCPKMSRYLTHIKRLKDPEETLQRFFETFEPMQKKMGPVLIQLPPSLKYDASVETELFKILRQKYRQYDFAIEARHQSWLEEDALEAMKRFSIAWVISQSGVGFPYLEAVTAHNVYVRFHGPKELYASSYSRQMLHDYAVKFKKWAKDGHEVWAYFNNTFQGIALKNADTLRKMTEAG